MLAKEPLAGSLFASEVGAGGPAHQPVRGVHADAEQGRP